MTECQYNDCENPAEISRETLSGYVGMYCSKHDPWLDGAVSVCFVAPKVGP